MPQQTQWQCSPDPITPTQTDCSITQLNSTTTPVYVQDSGNVIFLLCILIFLQSFIFMGFFFNIFNNRRMSRTKPLSEL